MESFSGRIIFNLSHKTLSGNRVLNNNFESTFKLFNLRVKIAVSKSIIQSYQQKRRKTYEEN